MGCEGKDRLERFGEDDEARVLDVEDRIGAGQYWRSLNQSEEDQFVRNQSRTGGFGNRHRAGAVERQSHRRENSNCSAAGIALDLDKEGFTTRKVLL